MYKPMSHNYQVTTSLDSGILKIVDHHPLKSPNGPTSCPRHCLCSRKGTLARAHARSQGGPVGRLQHDGFLVDFWGKTQQQHVEHMKVQPRTLNSYECI